jgi:microcystin-dependent protein
LYSAVQDKSANYTVVLADAGDLIRVTTTSGAVTITLPAISTVVDGFKVAIVKWTGDSNGVSIVRSGSDTINGATSAAIGSQYTSTTFVADFESNQWLSVTSGLGSTNVAVDQFSGNGSTVAFTLSGDAGSENNTQVFVSGVYQEKDTYSLSGTTLTFSAAPPTGTGNIEVVWTAPLAIGVPSDGTVTPAKMADVGVTAATYGSATEIPQISVNAKGQITSASNVAVSGVPVGAVEMFAMNTAPTGWLKANGAAVSRTTYSALFSAIGTVFGVGDGSTTFNVPDLRGEFIRGWDDARGIDSGRAFGSAQASSFASHTHTLTPVNSGAFANSTGIIPNANGGGGGAGTFTSNATGGTETRPRSIALLACIKF